MAGRNHDLVAARPRRRLSPAWTDDLLYRDRVLYETYNKMFSLVPTAELPWYRITWDQRPRPAMSRVRSTSTRRWSRSCWRRIRDGGPLSSTDIEPRAAIDWYWRPTNQVRALLEALAEAGILAIARREGNRRVYDLTERLFPAELARRAPAGARAAAAQAALALPGQRPARRDRRVHALDRHRARRRRTAASCGPSSRTRGELVAGRGRGPARATGSSRPATLAMLDAAEAEVAAEGEPAHPWAVGRPGGAEPGVTFLAPLDPLAWDRDLLLRLCGFDYRWEVYVPAAKRRWGYYVLPLLYGDRLVGRIEPRIDRKAKALRVARPVVGRRASTRSTRRTRASWTRWRRRSARTSPSRTRRG